MRSTKRKGRDMLKAKIRTIIETQLHEKTQGEIDAETSEFEARITKKEEQIKALNDQIKVLKTAQGASKSQKPDESGA
tara:strand:+ start:495 stop:728 length:234 start_codon:yes stop_codon:yes gene_type:complete